MANDAGPQEKRPSQITRFGNCRSRKRVMVADQTFDRVRGRWTRWQTAQERTGASWERPICGLPRNVETGPPGAAAAQP
jgi:hypothetical protein